MTDEEIAKALGAHLLTSKDLVDVLVAKGHVDSGDMRLTIVARQVKTNDLVNNGMSQRQAAKALGVSLGTVQRDLTHNGSESDPLSVTQQHPNKNNELSGISNHIQFAGGSSGLQTAAPGHRSPHSIGARILNQFGNGEWHGIKTITAALGLSELQVINSLSNNRHRSLAGYERKRVGLRDGIGPFAVRIFPTQRKKMISPIELKTKLDPLLAELKLEGKKNMATISIGTVAKIAFEIQQLVDGWVK